jgi:hypothetical protein
LPTGTKISFAILKTIIIIDDEDARDLLRQYISDHQKGFFDYRRSKKWMYMKQLVDKSIKNLILYF